MGTHPIFESDFDCLTEMSSVLSNGQLTVPDGLPAALESLARAVLKEQPTDLANFAATHFRVLLSQRSATGKDPFTDSTFFNNETIPPKFTDPLPDSQRQNEEEMGSGASKASSKASTPRKDVESPSHAEPSEQAVAEPTSEPVSEPVSEPASEPVSAPTEAADEPTAEEASQAQEDTQVETEQKSEVTEATEAIDIDLNDPGVEEAAVKIQAAFRGHQVRKDASADSGEAAESEPVTEEVADPASDEAPAEPSAPVEESVNEPQSEPASEPLTETAELTTEEAAVEAPVDDAATEEAPVEATAESIETAEEVTPAEPSSETADVTPAVEPAAEEIDIDLNDPKTEEAAVKIQAAFRGHQVRQEMTNGETEEVAAEETTATKNDAEEVIDIDLNDPQTEEAAVKIQAAFRGHQTRTEMAARMTDEADEAPRDTH